MNTLTEDSLGEGFAFFRWHVLTFPYSDCRGLRDKRPGCGIEVCCQQWHSGPR